MTTFKIWFPIVIGGLISLYCFMALLMKLFRPKWKYPVLKYGILIFTSFAMMVLLLWSFNITNAAPNDSWQAKIIRTHESLFLKYVNEDGSKLKIANKEKKSLGVDENKFVKQKSNSKFPSYLIVIYIVVATIGILCGVIKILYSNSNWVLQRKTNWIPQKTFETIKKILIIIMIGIFWPIVLYVIISAALVLSPILLIIYAMDSKGFGT